MRSWRRTGLQVLIALDQLANALLQGMADETLSARAWRNRHKPLGKVAYHVINGLFFWQPDHCRDAWLSEMRRSQLPRSYRQSFGISA